MMKSGFLWGALVVYLLISFVPQLALPNITGMGGKGKKT